MKEASGKNGCKAWTPMGNIFFCRKQIKVDMYRFLEAKNKGSLVTFSSLKSVYFLLLRCFIRDPAPTYLPSKCRASAEMPCFKCRRRRPPEEEDRREWRRKSVRLREGELMHGELQVRREAQSVPVYY